MQRSNSLMLASGGATRLKDREHFAALDFGQYEPLNLCRSSTASEKAIRSGAMTPPVEFNLADCPPLCIHSYGDMIWEHCITNDEQVDSWVGSNVSATCTDEIQAHF